MLVVTEIQFLLSLFPDYPPNNRKLIFSYMVCGEGQIEEKVPWDISKKKVKKKNIYT